jgi:glycosyltransferase involved in cell wall biosynthesis
LEQQINTVEAKTISAKYPSVGEIVIFQPEFVEFGGEERVILSLSRELHAQGKAHSILCYWDQIDLAKYAAWPLKVYQLNPTKNPLNKVLSLRRCLSYLHQSGNPVPVLFNIQSAYHAGLAVKAPYHVRIPDTYSLLGFKPEGADNNGKPVAKSLKTKVSEIICHYATKRGIQKADRFVTNTAALRDEMQALYNRSAEVIYLGGFGGPLESSPQRSARPIELFTVSRLQSSKRIDWILHALAEIRQDRQQYPEWRLHIAGSGPDREALQNLSQSLGLADAVIFHGFVSDAQLADLYEKSHVFLMPAKQGYGLPAIEALYQKLGLVVSAESGVMELLENTNWVTIARGGKQGFTTAMKEMLLRVGQQEFFDQPLPELPTEEVWAKKIIEYFRW